MVGKVIEIFKSQQGEGLYVGHSQVFLRMYGCNLSCIYCDTPGSYFQELSIEDVINKINSYRNYHSISFTGGEPLLQVNFIKEIMKVLKKKDKLIYLESNGILYNALEEVIPWVDIIAMDIKLPSATQCGSYFHQHRKFLEIGIKKEIFVKVVITPSTNLKDLEYALVLVKDVSPDIFFILQPAYPSESILRDRIRWYSDIAKTYLNRVKIIPQTHKILGIK